MEGMMKLGSCCPSLGVDRLLFKDRGVLLDDPSVCDCLAADLFVGVFVGVLAGAVCGCKGVETVCFVLRGSGVVISCCSCATSLSKSSKSTSLPASLAE